MDIHIYEIALSISLKEVQRVHISHFHIIDIQLYRIALKCELGKDHSVDFLSF